MIPQTPETEQLSKALISNDTQAVEGTGEKAGATGTSPLAVDSNRGTLLADDVGGGTATPKRRIKSPGDCDASPGKQLSPLRADDLHPSANSGC